MFFGAETPREISESIMEANGGKRTNRVIEGEIQVKRTDGESSYSY